MNFTASERFKMAIFQEEISGVLVDLMARSHVDNVVVEKEDGTQTNLAAVLADIMAQIATKAASADVADSIQAANDALYNKIMGITAEDGATVDEAYDTLKEVAAYLSDHGDVVQGFTTDIATLKTAVQGLQTGMTTVEKSDTNGNVKVDGQEVQVYKHPDTHPASMITDTEDKVIMTAAEREKLAGVSAKATAIVSGEGAIADATPVGKLMIKILPDEEPGNDTEVE